MSRELPKLELIFIYMVLTQLRVPTVVFASYNQAIIWLRKIKNKEKAWTQKATE
jgi:hypothetical protein